MRTHPVLLQLRWLKLNKEHVMKSKTLFYLILFTFFAPFIPTSHAQTFSVIHSFTGGQGGERPYAGVTIKGNALYGTTYGDPYCGQGGNSGGTVYQLSHSGSNWPFSTLTTLLPHDCNPEARVVFGPDGHLYGTAGNVFKLTPQVGPCRDVACYWTLTNLHLFTGYPDGAGPGYGDLIWDQHGNIYGTTGNGGAFNNGTVYELTPSGNSYSESIIYSFQQPSSYPSGLVLDRKGNLFGTTELGGIFGCIYDKYTCGTVFELTYVVGVGWTEQVIYEFQGDSGVNPLSGLIIDSAGNLYGTTSSGTVFELSPSGNTWIYKVLYSFFGQEWCGPAATLTMDAARNLYGTTNCEGIYNAGNVFKLSNTQNGWVYTSLHDFTGGSDGGAPISSNVTIDTDGTLYGTTAGGGNQNCGGLACGVVWMIKP